MVSVKLLFAINKDLFTHLAMNKNIKGVRNKQFFFSFISSMNVQVHSFITHTRSLQRENVDAFFCLPCIS